MEKCNCENITCHLVLSFIIIINLYSKQLNIYNNSNKIVDTTIFVIRFYFYLETIKFKIKVRKCSTLECSSVKRNLKIALFKVTNSFSWNLAINNVSLQRIDY